MKHDDLYVGFYVVAILLSYLCEVRFVHVAFVVHIPTCSSSDGQYPKGSEYNGRSYSSMQVIWQVSYKVSIPDILALLISRPKRYPIE